MFSGRAGDSTQQVVLCFDWCALGWMKTDLPPIWTLLANAPDYIACVW